jgi:hypothetical protein
VTSTTTTTAILARSPGKAGDCSKEAEVAEEEEGVEEGDEDEEEGELEGDDVDGVWERELLSVEDDCAALVPVDVKAATVPLSLKELAAELMYS